MPGFAPLSAKGVAAYNALNVAELTQQVNGPLFVLLREPVFVVVNGIAGICRCGAIAAQLIISV